MESVIIVKATMDGEMKKLAVNDGVSLKGLRKLIRRAFQTRDINLVYSAPVGMVRLTEDEELEEAIAIAKEHYDSVLRLLITRDEEEQKVDVPAELEEYLDTNEFKAKMEILFVQTILTNPSFDLILQEMKPQIRETLQKVIKQKAEEAERKVVFEQATVEEVTPMLRCDNLDYGSIRQMLDSITAENLETASTSSSSSSSSEDVASEGGEEMRASRMYSYQNEEEDTNGSSDDEEAEIDPEQEPGQEPEQEQEPEQDEDDQFAIPPQGFCPDSILAHPGEEIAVCDEPSSVIPTEKEEVAEVELETMEQTIHRVEAIPPLPEDNEEYVPTITSSVSSPEQPQQEAPQPVPEAPTSPSPFRAFLNLIKTVMRSNANDIQVPNMDEKLQQLNDMGFSDREKNLQLIKFHSQFQEGLQEVIEALLEQPNSALSASAN